DIVPARADKLVHFLAPVLLAAVAILTLGVIPYGRNMTPFAIDGGILFFFAVGSATELAVFMAGWASNNKFSMLGAMRAIAQMFSYELPLLITVLPVVMVVGSLMPDRIVAAQAEYTFGLVPRWFVFTPWGAAAFILFFVSGLVESNRTPFDVPEGESEIVAGHMTEYSGFKYATFFMAEYIGMFAISGLGVTLFLGGWQAPIAALWFIPSYVWFFAKLGALLFVYIWIRGTLPRARVDQIMNFAWKFMLPMAFTCIVAAVVWHYAEFVGLVQVFVYVGAVAVLIVFTILLTRRDVQDIGRPNWGGAIIAIAVFGGLLWAILRTPILSVAAPQVEALTVRRIGEVLMTSYVWPLQCVGLVLTAALIGALILVMEEKP